MKRLLATLLFCTVSLASQAQLSGQPMAIPGTGVSVVAPAGTRLAKFGPGVEDDAGAVSLSVSIRASSIALEKSPLWVGPGGLFRRPPEAISGALPGNLYRRERATDGGGWDGWLLSAPLSGGRTLTVLGKHASMVPATFEQLKRHVLSVSWLDTPLDPELAAGVALKPAGLTASRDMASQVLIYNKAGLSTAKDGLVMTVLPMQNPLAEAEHDTFAARCAATVPTLFSDPDNVTSGPTVDKAGYSYCEGWTKKPAPGFSYMAVVRLGTGIMLVVSGNGPADQQEQGMAVFRQALGTLRSLR